MNKSLLIGVLFIIVVLSGFLPVVTIWSLNVIFELSIPYTFKTWMAMFWLLAIIGGSGYKKSNS